MEKFKDKIETLRKEILLWYRRNGRNFPWRKSGRNVYEITVAEILLQHTRAEKVAEIYEHFLKEFPTPEKLREASYEKVKKIISPLGLHRRRAKLLLEIGEVLANDDGILCGEKLSSISGIGIYISNAVMLFGYGLRKAVVDTNIKRLYSRYFGLSVGKDVRRDRDIWVFAEKVLPKNGYKEFTWGVIDLSATICKKEKPLCNLCPLKKDCNYYAQIKKYTRYR